MSKNNSNKKDKNKIKKEKISQSVADFIKENGELLDYVDYFRKSYNKKKFVKVEKKGKLYKYLSETKIMIIPHL